MTRKYSAEYLYADRINQNLAVSAGGKIFSSLKSEVFRGFNISRLAGLTNRINIAQNLINFLNEHPDSINERIKEELDDYKKANAEAAVPASRETLGTTRAAGASEGVAFAESSDPRSAAPVGASGVPLEINELEAGASDAEEKSATLKCVSSILNILSDELLYQWVEAQLCNGETEDNKKTVKDVIIPKLKGHGTIMVAFQMTALLTEAGNEQNHPVIPRLSTNQEIRYPHDYQSTQRDEADIQGKSVLPYYLRDPGNQKRGLYIEEGVLKCQLESTIELAGKNKKIRTIGSYKHIFAFKPCSTNPEDYQWFHESIELSNSLLDDLMQHRSANTQLTLQRKVLFGETPDKNNAELMDSLREFDKDTIALLKNRKDGDDYNIQGYDFFNQNLTGVNLKGLDLTGANLTGANLTGANLTGTKLGKEQVEKILQNGRKDLSGVNLEGVDLSNLDLRDVKLTGANLTGANLTNITIDNNTQLSLAKLRDIKYTQLTYQIVDDNNHILADLKITNQNEFIKEFELQCKDVGANPNVIYDYAHVKTETEKLFCIFRYLDDHRNDDKKILSPLTQAFRNTYFKFYQAQVLPTTVPSALLPGGAAAALSAAQATQNAEALATHWKMSSFNFPFSQEEAAARHALQTLPNDQKRDRIQILLPSKNLVGMNLRGADLKNLDLSGFDVSKSDFRDAELQGITIDAITNFAHAKFSKFDHNFSLKYKFEDGLTGEIKPSQFLTDLNCRLSQFTNQWSNGTLKRHNIFTILQAAQKNPDLAKAVNHVLYLYHIKAIQDNASAPNKVASSDITLLPLKLADLTEYANHAQKNGLHLNEIEKTILLTRLNIATPPTAQSAGEQLGATPLTTTQYKINTDSQKEVYFSLHEKGDKRVINVGTILATDDMSSDIKAQEKTFDALGFAKLIADISKLQNEQSQSKTIDCIQIPLAVMKLGRKHYVHLQIYKDAENGISANIIDSTFNPIGIPVQAVQKLLQENQVSLKTALGATSDRVRVHKTHTGKQSIIDDKKCALYVAAGMRETTDRVLTLGINYLHNDATVKSHIANQHIANQHHLVSKTEPMGILYGLIRPSDELARDVVERDGPSVDTTVPPTEPSAADASVSGSNSPVVTAATLPPASPSSSSFVDVTASSAPANADNNIHQVIMELIKLKNAQPSSDPAATQQPPDELKKNVEKALSQYLADHRSPQGGFFGLFRQISDAGKDYALQAQNDLSSGAKSATSIAYEILAMGVSEDGNTLEVKNNSCVHHLLKALFPDDERFKNIGFFDLKLSLSIEELKKLKSIAIAGTAKKGDTASTPQGDSTRPPQI